MPEPGLKKVVKRVWVQVILGKLFWKAFSLLNDRGGRGKPPSNSRRHAKTKVSDAMRLTEAIDYFGRDIQFTALYTQTIRYFSISYHENLF